MTLNRSVLAAVLACAALLALNAGLGTPPARAAATYRFIDLQSCCTDTAGNAVFGLFARAINSKGHVAGSAVFGSGEHASLFRDGKYIDLGVLPNGAKSGARALNDSDTVAGWSENGLESQYPSKATHAMVWRVTQTPPQVITQDLGSFGGDTGCNGYSCISDAHGINSDGDVVGESQSFHGMADGFQYCWCSNPFRVPGGSRPMQYPGDDVHNENADWTVSGINDLGTIVAQKDENGHQNETTLFPGGSTLPFAPSPYNPINNAGDVVGGVFGSGPGKLAHAGTVITLPPLPGDTFSTAYGINNKGDVVGVSRGSCSNAVVWRHGAYGTPVDLNDLVAGETNWQLWEAYDINDNGQVVGAGTPSGTCGASTLSPFMVGPAQATVSGVVKSTFNKPAGDPVKGMTVQVKGTDAANKPVAVTDVTDSLGRYSVLVDPGNYTVAVTTKPAGQSGGKYAVRHCDGTISGEKCALDVEPTDALITADFTYQAGFPIAATITDDDDDPLPGANVVVSGTTATGKPFSKSATTNGEGRMSVPAPSGKYTIKPTGPGKPPGGHFYTHACSGKRQKHTCSSVIVNDAKPAGFARFAYLTKATIAGAITDKTDPRHKAAEVTIRGKDDNGHKVDTGVSVDKSGHYKKKVKPGTYTVTAGKPETKRRDRVDYEPAACDGVKAKLACKLKLGPPDPRGTGPLKHAEADFRLAGPTYDVKLYVGDAPQDKFAVVGGEPLTFTGENWDPKGGPITVKHDGKVVKRISEAAKFKGSLKAPTFAGDDCKDKLVFAQDGHKRSRSYQGRPAQAMAYVRGKVTADGKRRLKHNDPVCEGERAKAAHDATFAAIALGTPLAADDDSVYFGARVVAPWADISVQNFIATRIKLAFEPDKPVVVLPPGTWYPVNRFDTKGAPDLLPLNNSPYDEPLVIYGYARADTALTANGGIGLEGGVLYVNGDLHLKGSFGGTGAVAVKGSIGITGPAHWARKRGVHPTMFSNGPIVVRRH